MPLDERADAHPDPVVDDVDPHLDRVLRRGLDEQPLDGELEVVEVLEGEVEAIRDPAEHESRHGMPFPARGQGELDRLRLHARLGRLR